MKLSTKDIVILLLYTPVGNNFNYPIKGRTRLSKMIYLFEKEKKKIFLNNEIEDISDFGFYAWFYGPFSAQVYYDLEFLINHEFIETKNSNEIPQLEEISENEYFYETNDFEYYEDEFLLSSKGVDKSKRFWTILNNNQQDILIGFKEAMINSSLKRILEYVYRKYPESTSKSKIVERVIK